MHYQRRSMRYFARPALFVTTLVLSSSIAAAGNTVTWTNERPVSTSLVSQLAAFSAISPTRCDAADQYTECISLSPSQGPAGAQVTVNGTGWIDHANRGLDVPINIGMAEIARAHPNADGTFRVGLTIPSSTPEGELEIDAIIGNGGSASARYTVTAQTSPSTSCPSPRVYFSRTSGPIDTKVTISGNQWAPGGTVSITLPYGSQGHFSGPNMTPQVSFAGDWETEMTVNRTPPGEYVINLEEHTSECALKLSRTFRVTDSTSYPNPNTGGGLVNLCQKSQENREACIRILDHLLDLFNKMPVDIHVLTPLIDGCRAGNTYSCKQLQAKADSLGIG